MQRMIEPYAVPLAIRLNDGGAEIVADGGHKLHLGAIGYKVRGHVPSDAAHRDAHRAQVGIPKAADVLRKAGNIQRCAANNKHLFH